MLGNDAENHGGHFYTTRETGLSVSVANTTQLQ